jgi:DNA-binding NarL/FixJ family response regulator
MRVVIIDDHYLFRTGMRHVLALAGDLTLVGECCSAGDDAFAVIESQSPDVVLMDLALPGLDGVAATKQMRIRFPRVAVLVISVHDQLRDVLDALSAGAAGYALKSESPEALVNAIRTVGRGVRYLAPAVAAHVGRYENRRQQAFGVLEVLSERERTVFWLAANCLLTREIAGRLGISRKTVDTHLYRIHRKLAVRSSAELVRLASSLGMVTAPGDATAVQGEGLPVVVGDEPAWVADPATFVPLAPEQQ